MKQSWVNRVTATGLLSPPPGLDANRAPSAPIPFDVFCTHDLSVNLFRNNATFPPFQALQHRPLLPYRMMFLVWGCHRCIIWNVLQTETQTNCPRSGWQRLVLKCSHATLAASLGEKNTHGSNSSTSLVLDQSRTIQNQGGKHGTTTSPTSMEQCHTY